MQNNFFERNHLKRSSRKYWYDFISPTRRSNIWWDCPFKWGYEAMSNQKQEFFKLDMIQKKFPCTIWINKVSLATLRLFREFEVVIKTFGVWIGALTGVGSLKNLEANNLYSFHFKRKATNVQFKGTLARDFWLLFFFIKIPQSVPWFTP